MFDGQILKIIQSNKKFFYFIFGGFIVPAYILSVIYSEGFYHYDEHWQILEFAKYKLGEVDASRLPWEFPNKMRAAIQPAIAYITIQLTRIFLFTDGTALLLLRLFSGILGVFCYGLILQKNFPTIKSKKLQYFSLLFCTSIWFLPYLHVRFSSENWGGIFFWFAFCLFNTEEKRDAKEKLLRLKLLCAGILLGISFQCRYQMGFCIIGLFLWLWIIHERWKISKILLIPFLSMCITIILITYYLDGWFYGEHVIPPYNYFYQNIVLGKVAGYGNSANPFHYLFQGAESFILPFGIFFIFAILSFFYLKPKHPFTWILIPYIVIHSIISNRQLRFMFPLIYVFPIMIIHTLNILSEKYPHLFKNISDKKNWRIVIKIYFVINFVILINRAFYPAFLSIANINFVQKDIQKRFEGKKTYILSPINNGLYQIGNLFLSFYRPKNLTEQHLSTVDIKTNTIKQLQEFKNAESIDFIYLSTHHTRFYSGRPPFPKSLEFLKNQCQYLFNPLDDIRMKYNVYRLIRQKGSLQSIYLCKT